MLIFPSRVTYDASIPAAVARASYGRGTPNVTRPHRDPDEEAFTYATVLSGSELKKQILSDIQVLVEVGVGRSVRMSCCEF